MLGEIGLLVWIYLTSYTLRKNRTTRRKNRTTCAKNRENRRKALYMAYLAKVRQLFTESVPQREEYDLSTWITGSHYVPRDNIFRINLLVEKTSF